MKKVTLLLLAIGCTPLDRSESKQVADASCVNTALAAHLVRPTDEFVIAAGYFCIDRGRHDQATEDRLRGTGGTKPVRTEDGFGWLPLDSVAGATVGGSPVRNLWVLGIAGNAS